MLIPRVIPALLLDKGAFVKTRKFKKPNYVGDPVNVINLFNRFEVDEIALLDIRASLEGREPDFALIEQLASECWVPLAYGGGLKTWESIQRVFRIGVEKLIFNTTASEQPDLIRKAASVYGSQAIVGSIDVKRNLWGHHECWIKSGTKGLKVSPVKQALQLQDLGVGEILLMNIDRDGEMSGFDLELIRQVTEAIDIPLIACGGAGSREDLSGPIQQSNASAVAAGSLFVYQNKERGVLINYPERSVLEFLLSTPPKNHRS